MKEDLIPFEWDRIFVGLPNELYYLEVGLRVLIVFLFLLVMFRFLGKRSQRDLTPMQNILMISLGTAVGDVMLYAEIPLFYSFLILLLVTTLIYILSTLTVHSIAVQKFVLSKSVILVKDGDICREKLDEQRLSENEVYTMLRVAGVEFLEEVRYAIFEPTGEISIYRYDESNYEKNTSLIDKINTYE